MKLVGKRVTIYHRDNLSKVNYTGAIIKVKENGSLVILQDGGGMSIPDLPTIHVHRQPKKEEKMEKSCLTCKFGKSEKQEKGYYCNNPEMIRRCIGPDGEECWYNSQSPCGQDS